MTGAQEFERVLDGSDKSVASFEASRPYHLMKRAQHFLHSTPAAVPLIVLVLAIVIFGIAIGGRFFSSYTLTLILQQIAIVGILGAAQTLVILTAGIDLSIGVIMVHLGRHHGQLRHHLRHPDADRRACRHACRRPLRPAQRLPGRLHEAAAVHRHARHVEHRDGDELHLLGQRDDPRHRRRRAGTAATLLRAQLQARQRGA